MLLSEDDTIDLKRSVKILETPGVAARISAVIGTPIDGALKRLPDGAQEKITKAVTVSLDQAMKAALMTMRDPEQRESSDWIHMGLATTSGAVGGFFGLAALAVELPITTVIILRSIADIARAEGEKVDEVDVIMACMEVFALGSTKNSSDDAAESGYYAVRVGLSKMVNEAAAQIAKSGVQNEIPSALMRVISAIGARFGVVVSQKAAAQILPIIGAAGGAGLNAIFMDHYQSMARGHFTVRRLERTYGKDVIRQKYNELAEEFRHKKSFKEASGTTNDLTPGSAV